MEQNRYWAYPDTQVKIITNIVLMVCVIIVALRPFGSFPDPGLRNSIIFLLLPLQLFIWLLRPRYYSVTDTGVAIKRPLTTLRLPFSEIKDMRTLDWSEMGMTFRIFASGGLFGYLGIYSSSVFGRFFMWCTNKDRLVLITCHNKFILISPSDPLAFVLDYNIRSRNLQD